MEGVGEQDHAAPAVPGPPADDLSGVQAAGLLGDLAIFFDAPSGRGDVDQAVPRQNAATMALACGLTGPVPADKIVSCACLSALSVHAPGVRLADVAGPRSSVEGRGDLGVASRGGGVAASGWAAEAGLGRSGRSRGHPIKMSMLWCRWKAGSNATRCSEER